jgi:hypothetical protein
MKSATMSTALGIRQHALRLVLDLIRRRELPGRRRREQRRVRHGPPQKIREPVGDLVVAELHDAAVFDGGARIHLPVVDEARRLQHRLDEQIDRPVEVQRQRRARRLIERGEVAGLGGAQRPAVDLGTEGRDELAGAPGLGRRVGRRAG